MSKLNDCFSQPAKMLTLNEAVARFSENIVSVCKAEKVKLASAEGRIIFSDIISSIDVPPHNNSAVDGFAVYHDDLNVSGSTTLPIRGRVVAGGNFVENPGRGQAIQIFTGAPIPQRTKALSPDTIFMIEDVVVDGDTITLPEGQMKGANIRMAGEDVKRGDTVINCGKRLRPQDIGMLAAIGYSKVKVRAPLKVAIFSTGDEICDPGEKIRSAQIFDINRYSLMSLLKKLGCKVNDMGILPDDKDAIRESIRSASRNNDLLLTSGGVSMGEEDHVRTAINELGKLHFWPSLIFMNGIFMPMFIVGLAGVSRRLYDGGQLYAHAKGVLQWNEFMSISAFCLGLAQIPFIVNIFMSLFSGEKAAGGSTARELRT